MREEIEKIVLSYDSDVRDYLMDELSFNKYVKSRKEATTAILELHNKQLDELEEWVEKEIDKQQNQPQSDVLIAPYIRADILLATLKYIRK